MTTGEEDGAGPSGQLSSAFRALKRRGPQILVTGDVPEYVSRKASRRLLGHPEERRHRVLVLTDSATEADEWLPVGLTGGSAGAEVVRAGFQRDTAAAAGPDAGGARVADEPDGESVSTATWEAVEAWRTGRDVPPPSELRVGVYSLETLIEREGLRAVRSLLCRLTGSVRWARGMGHYHLPRDPMSDPVVDLQYVFDARLDLRNGGDGAEQRWHLPGTGTTGWVSLDDEP